MFVAAIVFSNIVSSLTLIFDWFAARCGYEDIFSTTWLALKGKLVKRLGGFIAGSFLVLLLWGCGKPLPSDKVAYSGVWESPTMALLITQDGTVSYKRLKNGGTVSVNGPIQTFEGNNFSVGFGPISSVFVVSKAPYQDGGQIKMVVDGVTLVRTSNAE